MTKIIAFFSLLNCSCGEYLGAPGEGERTVAGWNLLSFRKTKGKYLVQSNQYDFKTSLLFGNERPYF